MNKKPGENRTTHLVFLRDEPLREIVAGRKRFELRLSFRGLACASVREGDVLLLKRVGGEVEAACDVGEVRMYRGLIPEEVARLARSYANATSWSYLRRYVPPHNRDRPVDLAIIELLNVCPASLPVEVTPRGVRSGWVANFGGTYAMQKEP
jgi:hypothetical protein